MCCASLTAGVGNQRQRLEKNTDTGHAQILITTMPVQIAGLWNVTPCSYVDRCGCFGVNCRLQLQGTKVDCTASYPTRQQSTTRTHRSGSTYTHARIHIHTQTHTYTRGAKTHTHFHTYIHTYTHTHTHTCIHA